MRFLADENVEAEVVRVLRSKGFDVHSVSERSRQARDEVVLRTSLRETRILITSDKDFAELLFLRRRAALGVVLMRMHDLSSARKARRLTEAIRDHGVKLKGSLTVVEGNASRRRPFPRE